MRDEKFDLLSRQEKYRHSALDYKFIENYANDALERNHLEGPAISILGFS